MADRTSKHTIAPQLQPSIRLKTRTTDIGEYGLPASVTKDERKLIADAITAVTQREPPTDMEKLDLYLGELENKGLTAYISEIRAARETLHTVMRAGGEWKALMRQSDEHWVLGPMLMRLS